MKAALIDSYGPPEKLYIGEIPIPEPGSKEVLINIKSIGLNPIDLISRANGNPAANFPMILGWDIAGVVVEVGAGANRFRKGDRVFGMIRFPATGKAYAQYVTAPENELSGISENIDYASASCVAMAGLTAWQSLFQLAQLRSGQTILIHGAAGGVGHLAVQLARVAGAEIFCTASSENKDFLVKLGASRVVDYKNNKIETAFQNIDLALDTQGGNDFFRLINTLRDGGSIVTLKGTSKEHKAVVEAHRINVHYTYVKPDSEILASLMKLMSAHKLIVEISHRFNLDNIISAHRLAEAGHVRGKIAIEMN